MKELKRQLPRGAVFGLLLFVAERLFSGRVHMGAMPGGDDLSLWLLATAGLYLLAGLVLGAVMWALPLTRGRPGLTPHAGAAGVMIATVALLPNWTAILATAGSAAVVSALAWAVPRRPTGAGRDAAVTALAAAVAVTVSLHHPHGLDAPPAPAGGEAADGAPDLVLIVLDTVRRDRVSAYGYDRPTTPRFDALARRGVLLERAYSSAPWSLPAHASLFTGLSPGAHGAHYENPLLDGRIATVADVLRRHGYTTVGVSGNPWLNRDNGTARGFDVWHDSVPVRDLSRCFVLRWLLADHLLRGKGGDETVATVERLLDGDLATLEGPLLLFVNVFEAHVPYDQVPPACGRTFLDPGLSRRRIARVSDRIELAQSAGTSYLPEGPDRSIADALYDGAVRCADDVVGRVLDAVERRRRPAVIVVLADHGESLGEHELMGHHHGLYDVLIHVPMVVVFPQEIPPRSTLEEPVSIVDLAPTLLDYAGVPPEDWPPAEGSSLRLALAGRSALGWRDVFAEHYVPLFVLEAFRFARPAGRFPEVNRRRRTVVARDVRYEIDSWGEERLFDLASDPLERRDLLAASDPDRAETLAALRRDLRDWIERTGGRWSAPPDGVPATHLPTEAVERLRALGYVK